MAGRIKAEDIAAVKDRAGIEDVVREHVTLRSAGPGSLKGLCPFHDEKTPSFTVRPAVGAYHCFGCGEGGDVIEFVQKVDHLTFTEAVERLAQKAGVELHYEDGPAPQRENQGRRARLVEANRTAAAWFAENLIARPDARPGRDFLRAKGFDGKAAAHFGVGWAPRGFSELGDHLQSKGFSREELVLAGLVGQTQRGGTYDRFRGRVVWPIRDVTGDTVGFGARRIFDDDRIEAKYLNTSETPIYKKTSVLYGLDLAKKAMARDRQAVVVEGYTDVMAAHLAGVETAVATCGTAFGVEHIKTLRRILRDEAGQAPARVVFTFDGDAAGQKAAMRAFQDDQRWASQSFVAVAPAGQDPNELRQSGGDDAVRHLVEDAVPMFEFAVRTTMARFDLATAEGRVGAARAVAPIITTIRDEGLRPEYVRTVSGWLGMTVEQVQAEVDRAERNPQPLVVLTPKERAEQQAARPRPVVDLRDPVQAGEYQLLQCLLQFPSLLTEDDIEGLVPESFSSAPLRAVYAAMESAGGIALARSVSERAWSAAVVEQSGPDIVGLLNEMAVKDLPTRLDPQTGAPSPWYAQSLLIGVRVQAQDRAIADAISALQRDEGTDPSRTRELSVRISTLQRERVALVQQLS